MNDGYTKDNLMICSIYSCANNSWIKGRKGPRACEKKFPAPIRNEGTSVHPKSSHYMDSAIIKLKYHSFHPRNPTHFNHRMYKPSA